MLLNEPEKPAKTYDEYTQEKHGRMSTPSATLDGVVAEHLHSPIRTFHKLFSGEAGEAYEAQLEERTTESHFEFSIFHLLRSGRE